jgi:catechol 2,3-dioxygenase-like lactoylglutathione lyase family enzyme
VIADADVIAFVSTADPDRACAFYRDVLCLELVERNAFASVFDANGTMLRVTTVDRVDPARYTVLGWLVGDIDATLRELAGRGVEPVRYDGMEQDAAGVWTSPSGARIAWFRDPDDNTLSLTQRS